MHDSKDEALDIDGTEPDFYGEPLEPEECAHCGRWCLPSGMAASTDDNRPICKDCSDYIDRFKAGNF